MEDYNYPDGEYQRPERVVEQIIFDQTEYATSAMPFEPETFAAYVIPLQPLVLMIRRTKGQPYTQGHKTALESSQQDDMIALWQAALQRYEQWKAVLPEGVKSRRDSRTHDDVPF